MSGGAGRSVAVDQVEVAEAGEPLCQLERVRDRRAREQEPRLCPVDPRDPAEPAEHVADVRAEHAAVHVRLVDDDECEVREQLAPSRVVGEDPEMEHVGVREHHVRALADRRTLLAGCVAVVDRGTDPLVEAEGVEAPRLVLGKRLRRVEVERAGGGVLRQHLERRQLKAERLARRGPGRDDRLVFERGVERPRLVLVELRDPRLVQRTADGGIELSRHRHEARLPRLIDIVVNEPLVATARLQQARPGLRLAGGRHRPSMVAR